MASSYNGVLRRSSQTLHSARIQLLVKLILTPKFVSSLLLGLFCVSKV